MPPLKTLRKVWREAPYHWLLPLVFFCVGLVYLFASPNFEASDTERHVALINWIAKHGQLPVQSPSKDTVYRQQASQPPLYYLVMAAIWRVMDTAEFDDYYQPNPLVIAGVPERLGNRNLVFYRQPYPPDLRGTSLALYVIRALTLAMGAVTVAAVYQSARTVMPERTGFAVLAASLVAFNPMFIFISASVSNDPPVSMLTALIAWQMLRMLREGFQTRRSLILALLVAIAALTKLNGLVLGATAALAGCYVFYRSRDWRGFLTLGLLMLGCWLALSGWWYLRNLNLYGELFGTGAMLDNFGRRNISPGRLIREEFEGLRISFWALFGAFSILTHKLFYLAMDGLSLLGAVGLVLFMARNRRRSFALSAVFFLGLALALGGAMLIWWSSQTSASTGRLLFPYITSISLLLALGLVTLRIPPLVIALPMFLFAAIAPIVYIAPNYDHPPVVDQLPADALPTQVRWGDTSLVGYHLPAPRRWTAGDEIPVTLYWQPLAQTQDLQALFLTLLNADGEAIATVDTFPGWGSLPTTWWQPGQIYKDDYILQIPKDAPGFSTMQLHIGWYPFPDGSDIRPLLESGEEAASFILPLGAFVSGADLHLLGDDATSQGTVFGDAIRLNAFRLSEGHILDLEWRLVAPISGAWRVFAIVLAEPYQEGAPFEIVWQRDGIPAVPVGFLNAEEAFVTRHAFKLPPGYQGEHAVYVGWYNEDLGQRLPVAYPSNMLPLPLMNLRGPAS
ncbi:MAG: hypothetical protein F4X02_14015 [Chloroflexi bacterium]|nr:hypothetical protein [Chloroflexota bacterium]